MMKKLLMLALLVAVTACDAKKPNIIFILADDLGLGDIGHHVRTYMEKEPFYETPTMDALAKEGLWFTDGHSSTALCSPTRYCIMSGNNNYRSYAPWGVWGTFRPTAFQKGEVTLGSVVKDAGYNTGFIGKWHLGGDFMGSNGEVYRGGDSSDISDKVDLTKYISWGPKDCGFDYDFTLPCGIQGPIYLAYENEKWYPLHDDSKIVSLTEKNAIDPKFVSDKGPGMGDSHWDAREIGKVISAKAVDFIKANAKKKEPFFLYYCSPMVHKPHCPTDEFDGVKIKGETPSRHLDMVIDFDLQVKRIVDALKATGSYENTLFVLSSDNGGLVIDPDTVKSGHQSSGGWAGAKNSPLEGGHRVPFIVVWPGVVKPGTVTDEPAINHDMLATFADLVGTKIPSGEARDSNNLLPLLTGKGNFKQRDYIILQSGSMFEAIYREDPWKLIIQSDSECSKWEPKMLFNLKDNPKENMDQNFVNDPEHKQRVKKMLKKYLDIRESGRRTVPK